MRDYADFYLFELKQMLDIMILNFSTEDCRFWRCKGATGIFVLNVRTGGWPIDISVINIA